MTTDAEDRSTWPRNRQIIRRAELLRLIEENRWPADLDLRGAMLVGEGAEDNPAENPIDLSPEALAPLAEAYRAAKPGWQPPWLAMIGGMNLDHARLDGAVLCGARLERGLLWHTVLRQAVLSGCQLQGADLWDANLQEANLSQFAVVERGRTDAPGNGVDVAVPPLPMVPPLPKVVQPIGGDPGGSTFAGLSRRERLRRLRAADMLIVQSGADPADLTTDRWMEVDAANLEGAELTSADLTGANLAGVCLRRADLTDARLHGAGLRGARLEGAYFSGVALQGHDMYEVGSLDGAHWHGALLDHTRIRQKSLGKAVGDELTAHTKKTAAAYHQAKEAYLLLKNNFNQIGRYEDASWAYVKEQQMEKMAYYREWRSHRWQVWRAWGSFWRWLRNWAYELATGYGERPWNPVIGGGLIILGFAGAFCATRAIANFWDALVYSIATFATFNLADTGPTGRAADLASSVEALLGIALLALVVFTLGNKMSRG